MTLDTNDFCGKKMANSMLGFKPSTTRPKMSTQTSQPLFLPLLYIDLKKCKGNAINVYVVTGNLFPMFMLLQETSLQCLCC